METSGMELQSAAGHTVADMLSPTSTARLAGGSDLLQVH